jgi:isochorismate hydrolase
VSNMEKLKQAGVAVHEMSPEEKQVVETLSPEETDTLLKARGKYDSLIKGTHPSTSLKIL